MVKAETELTGAKVRELRQSLGLCQRVFWGAVCSSKGQGSGYELERRDMPPYLRRLVFLHYIVGLPTGDAEKMNSLAKLARVGESVLEARKHSLNEIEDFQHG